MTLLKLAPDSERLRRIARAYAAGEMEEKEYRRIRAEVIDSFVAVDHAGDDTEQRWSAPEGDPAASKIAPAAAPQISSPQTPAGHWLVGAGLAVAALSTVIYLLMV